MKEIEIWEEIGSVVEIRRRRDWGGGLRGAGIFERRKLKFMEEDRAGGGVWGRGGRLEVAIMAAGGTG